MSIQYLLAMMSEREAGERGIFILRGQRGGKRRGEIERRRGEKEGRDREKGEKEGRDREGGEGGERQRQRTKRRAGIHMVVESCLTCCWGRAHDEECS